MIGCFEEKNENKYLVLDDVDENKYVSKKYEEVWEGVKKILMLNVNVNKYGVKCSVKCGTSLRFWENKGWINKIDPYGWFQWYFRYWLGRRSKDDERQINRWKKIMSRFRGKLVKMIKDVGSKFDDYSISPKIRQILLHWGYELTEEDFFNELSN